MDLIDEGASQIEIAHQFPMRKWKMIRRKVWSIRRKGSLKPRPKPIKDQETYLDYLARTNADNTSANMASEGRSGIKRRDARGKSRQGVANCRRRPSQHD